MTAVVVGDLVTDIVAVPAGPLAAGSDVAAAITITGGGSAANTAAWLGRLGVPVTLIGVVGDDAAGVARIAELRAAGVRCAVRAAPGAKTGSIVVLSAGGDRTMLADRGANGLLTPADIDVAGARWVHVSGYTLFDPDTRAAGIAALEAARSAGATASVDAASAAPLRAVGGSAFFQWTRAAHVLFANTDEARALLNTVDARELASATGGEAILKAGAEGATWSDGAKVIEVPARPARPIDPTGAGDAFAAAYVAARLRGAGVREALEAGTIHGAEAVGRVGARPPLP